MEQAYNLRIVLYDRTGKEQTSVNSGKQEMDDTGCWLFRSHPVIAAPRHVCYHRQMAAVLVTDEGRNSLHVLDPNTLQHRKEFYARDEEYMLPRPYSVGVLSWGGIVMGNSRSGEICIFTSRGELEQTWYSADGRVYQNGLNMDPEECEDTVQVDKNICNDLTVDYQDRIIVCNSNCLEIFQADGTLIQTLKYDDNFVPRGVTTDNQGRMIVVSSKGRDKLTVLGVGGQLITHLDRPDKSIRALAMQGNHLIEGADGGLFLYTCPGEIRAMTI